MKKEEYIKKYGEEAYEKKLQYEHNQYKAHPEKKKKQSREWYQTHPEKAKETRRNWAKNNPEATRESERKWRRNHPEELKEYKRLWRQNNPDKIKTAQREGSHKGGKYYEQKQNYRSAGLPYNRDLVRGGHRYFYTPYKKIIDPEGLTQIHHQWILGTPEYTGMALVEKDQHMHGFIDVIQILEGEITLLTEEEIKNKSER